MQLPDNSEMCFGSAKGFMKIVQGSLHSNPEFSPLPLPEE